jgi:hypothetical protein
MRAIAVTVQDAPPLRLDPAADELLSPARGGPGRQRRWRSWAAPLTAAAVVVALAISLVIVRDIPNGRMVPLAPAAPTGPGGIPRYYVTTQSVTSNPDGPRGLLVGDSLTGKAVATVAPPGHMSFIGVSAAADDRTFVVYAVSTSATTETGHWFELRLAPGTADPARLTPLPVKSETVPLEPKLPSLPQYGVFAMALSASAQELAVAEVPSAAGGVAVKVYSVATGQLLHEWTTRDLSAPDLLTIYSLSPPPPISWIDGDRALAVTAGAKGASAGSGAKSVRELSVDGPRNGDLLADSKVIWSPPAEDKPPAGTQEMTCGLLLLAVSADGKTVSCFTLGQQQVATTSVTYTLTFSTYRLTAGTAGSGQRTIAYQLTKRQPSGSGGTSAGGSLLWVSPSGDTLIGVWAVGANATSAVDNSPPPHIGVISHGKFTPLRFPAGFTLTGVGAIAW